MQFFIPKSSRKYFNVKLYIYTITLITLVDRLTAGAWAACRIYWFFESIFPAEIYFNFRAAFSREKCHVYLESNANRKN